jgi:3-phenylpropionate/trans-cinnamate dioxygenase ferredoxin reductase subunit
MLGFRSEQGPLRLQTARRTTGFQPVVLRGDCERGEYSAFCYAGDRLLGIESINRPADHAFARRLLATGRGVTPAQAANESFDLRAAATARPV